MKTAPLLEKVLEPLDGDSCGCPQLHHIEKANVVRARARALECCVCVRTQKQTNNVVDWYHGVVRPILPLVTLKHLLNRVSISSLSGD